MLFNSIDFILFFPCVVTAYVLIPARLRHVWLLICSYFFYMCWNPVYIVLILGSTILTYGSGLAMEKADSRMKKRCVLVLCFAFNLGILFYFKYLNFVLLELWRLLTAVGFSVAPRTLDIVLPVGISFYTFQALGYTVDCYRGDIKAERSFLHYALFVSFFPQLVAGPIERSKNLLRQLHDVPRKTRRELLSVTRIRSGLILMIWGLFLKMVIADRAAILVDRIYTHYTSCGTVALSMAVIAFGIQIYCDFGSYSIIALGAARVMDFSLMENFKAPYLATSMTDFWRRWHISLSTWFRDYLYIPLGGNRKGSLRRMINLFITFTISGLWHGASMTFVFWGSLHGLLLIIENLLRPALHRLHSLWDVRTESFGYKICRAGVVFSLTNIAWVFFRADSISMALHFLSRLVTYRDWWSLSDGSVFQYGLPTGELFILIAGVLLLFAVDLIRVRKHVMLDAWLETQWSGFRILFVLFLVFTTLMYGQYGPGFDSRQFIYFQF